MDKIPLQTLKNVEKVSSEEQVMNISLEVSAVLRNFKPTVRSRREFERDDSYDFDPAFEKELDKIESEVDNVYLRETLPKIEAELSNWIHEYKSLLDEYSKLHDDNIKDQALLRVSDCKIQEKLDRIAIVEKIRTSLLAEVRNLCLVLEKTRSESYDKIKRSSDNFRDIIHYLNRGFDKERATYQSTVEILRKLEHTLRSTINKYENAQANVEVLQEELKETKRHLHSTQRELQTQNKETHKSMITIQQLQIDLEDARERAATAERTLDRYRQKY